MTSGARWPRKWGGRGAESATEDAVAKNLAETNGTGVDALLEMSGNPTAIQQGFKALRAGGRASLLGIPTENVPLDLVNDVIFKGATVQDLRAANVRNMGADDGAAEGGRLNLEPLFGERTSLDKFESAFTLLQSGLAGKILLYPNGMPRERIDLSALCSKCLHTAAS